MKDRRAYLAFVAILGLGCGGSKPEPTAAARAQAEPARASTPSPVPSDSEEGDCEVEVEGPESTQVGHSATARVALRATGGYKVNREAPLSVHLVGNAVRPSKASFSHEDASFDAADELHFEIPFTSDAPGDHALEVHAKFGICSDATCSFCSRARGLELHTTTP
jgi:hypothetical protein